MSSERKSQAFQRGYQAALDDMAGRPRVYSPCQVCGEPIPPSRGGGARLQCSRECTVAMAHSRAKQRALEAKGRRR